jgi:hypothetical protein
MSTVRRLSGNFTTPRRQATGPLFAQIGAQRRTMKMIKRITRMENHCSDADVHAFLLGLAPG